MCRELAFPLASKARISSIVGGTAGSLLARKGVCKEDLVQIISVTDQVAISCRVHTSGINWS